MNSITPEDRKLNPIYRTKYRVIITDSSGQVVKVTKSYATENAAFARADKETSTSQLPTLYATLLAYQEEN